MQGSVRIVVGPGGCTVVVATLLFGFVQVGAGCGASEDNTANSPPDAATPDTSLDAAQDAQPDGDQDVVAPDASDSPTDVDRAVTFARAALVGAGIDPDDPVALRAVWNQVALYGAYLEDYAAAAGEELPRALGDRQQKAVCNFLGAYNEEVAYCGPGCAGDLTLSPVCLNRFCWQHDRCYAAYECESGVLVDVAQSFGSLMVCCDAPLNTAWAACLNTVASDFSDGTISAAEVTLFNAVSALMVLMNRSSLFDPPTDAAPATCEQEWEDACAIDLALTLTVTPARLTEAGATAEICATLLDVDEPVETWLLSLQTDGPGTLDVTQLAITDAPTGRGCVTYTAPESLGSEPVTVTFAGIAEVADEEARATATLLLDPGALSLGLGASPPSILPGGTSRLCALAEQGGVPVDGLLLEFERVDGPGTLSLSRVSTASDGTACLDLVTEPSDGTGTTTVRVFAVDDPDASAQVRVAVSSGGLVTMLGLEANGQVEMEDGIVISDLVVSRDADVARWGNSPDIFSSRDVGDVLLSDTFAVALRVPCTQGGGATHGGTGTAEWSIQEAHNNVTSLTLSASSECGADSRTMVRGTSEFSPESYDCHTENAGAGLRVSLRTEAAVTISCSGAIVAAELGNPSPIATEGNFGVFVWPPGWEDDRAALTPIEVLSRRERGPFSASGTAPLEAGSLIDLRVTATARSRTLSRTAEATTTVQCTLTPTTPE